MRYVFNPFTGTLDTVVDDPLLVANGGTGAATFTTNGVLYGNSTSAIQVTAQGAANSVLTANAGAPSFSAAPTIGTSVTTPIVIGGSGTTSTLSLRSTSGAGTTGADIIFQTGNNGGTEAARFLNSGFFGIGQTNPSCRFRLEQATTFGTYVSHSNTTSTVDATSAIFSTLTATTPNIFQYGLFVETTQAFSTGTPIQVTAALNAFFNITSGDAQTYNAVSLGIGGFYVAEYGGTGQFASAVAILGRAQTSNSGGCTNLKAGLFNVQHITTNSGTVTNAYGIHIDRPTSLASHTITNTYGLRIENQTAAAGTQTNTPYGIYQVGTGDFVRFDGKLGIGMDPTKQIELSTDSAQKPTTNTWTITSDVRVKELIRDYPEGLPELRGIRPVIYRYNGRGGFPKDGKDYVGVIAQEIAEVMPSTVTIAPHTVNSEHYDDFHTFNSHNILFAVINAIKELDIRLQAIEAATWHR